MSTIEIKNSYPHKISGWIMKKNQETWDMVRDTFIIHTIAFSILKKIDTNEDREFFEYEISKQFGYDYFELDSFQII
jgi:hypothetical protein